jgi:hypothetical protein
MILFDLMEIDFGMKILAYFFQPQFLFFKWIQKTHFIIMNQYFYYFINFIVITDLKFKFILIVYLFIIHIVLFIIVAIHFIPHVYFKKHDLCCNYHYIFINKQVSYTFKKIVIHLLLYILEEILEKDGASIFQFVNFHYSKIIISLFYFFIMTMNFYL